MNCIKPIRDIIKSPLPPLEEITIGVSIQLREVVKHGTQSRRDMDVAIRTTNTIADWFLENPLDCEHDIALNAHLVQREPCPQGESRIRRW